MKTPKHAPTRPTLPPAAPDSDGGGGPPRDHCPETVLVAATMAGPLPVVPGSPAALRSGPTGLLLLSGSLTVGGVTEVSDTRLGGCVARGADYRGQIIRVRDEQVDAELTRAD